MNRLTRASIASLAAALVIPISGCAALISPQQTHEYRYAAGDGKAVSVGGVDVRSLKVVGTAADEPGQLLYVAVNNTDQVRTLSITIAGEEFAQTLTAGEVFRQNPDDGVPEAIVTQVGKPAGALVDVVVEVNGEVLETHAQVIGPAQHDYAEYVPGGAPTTSPAERVFPEGEEAGGH